jgi:hypothetical protein
MHSLTQKELETLIKLESEGKLTPDDLYKRVALKTVQNKDNYVTSAIIHLAIGAACVGVGGSVVAPVFLFFWGYSWFKSYKTRTESIRRINAGDFADYLEPDDRTSYEQDYAVKTVEIATVAAAPADGAVIGNDTKLGAIAVPAAAVQAEGGAVAVAIPAPVTTGYKSLLTAVAENPKSSFFAAPARTGKGITIAACIRMTQKRVTAGTLTSVKFWAMTPKQDPKENWYWETCNRFFNPDIENGDRARAARGIYQFIREFDSQPRTPQSPTILVVDELTRLVGLLKGVKMEAVDPELFAGDSQSFSNWLVDKLILSASMSQSIGYYVWIATPSSTVSGRGFNKDDVDSLNIYTLATKSNLKFADGGMAAFSAPKTDENHPVFTRGYVAGYCHQTRTWYHVPNLTADIQARENQPTQLKNYWVPASMGGESMQMETSPVATATAIAPHVDDRFSRLTDKLTAPEQSELKSFIEWLGTQKGKEITFDQVQNGWGRRNASTRAREHINSLIGIAKSQKLLTVLPNSNYQISEA